MNKIQKLGAGLMPVIAALWEAEPGVRGQSGQYSKTLPQPNSTKNNIKKLAGLGGLYL